MSNLLNYKILKFLSNEIILFDKQSFKLISGRALRAAFLLPLLAITFVYSSSAADTYSCTVTKIIDGDTFRCTEQNGKEISVRLTGIDTPELNYHPKTAKHAARTGTDAVFLHEIAESAKKFAEKIIPPGKTVRLELDIDPRDGGGRTLAYVWLEDGRMLNEVIMSEGLALPLTIYPNVKYRERFYHAQTEAMRNSRGIWAD